MTSAGHDLLERARRVLLEVNDLVAQAGRSADLLAGTLRLGVIPTVAPYLLPAVTPRLRDVFPRLTVAWVEEKTEVLVRGLESGKLDGALLALEAEIGDVEHAEVASDPFVLAAPQDHPLVATTAPVSVTELRDTGVLLLDLQGLLPEAVPVGSGTRA